VARQASFDASQTISERRVMRIPYELRVFGGGSYHRATSAGGTQLDCECSKETASDYRDESKVA
jgi:hypothetical protein